MRYLLLLKRLLKKKSYIAMLLLVPLMAFILKSMTSADAGLLTIGVFIPGDDYSSEWLKENLMDEPGNLRFILYDEEEELINDVKNQQLQEAWICPQNLDDTVASMAEKGSSKEKLQIVIREEGLSHLLAKEVLCSRVYPLIARQMALNYILDNVYDSSSADSQIDHILDTYDNYGINGNLFEMGYLDDNQQASDDMSYLMMPYRGILALWLLMLAVAASMYYLEDQSNGLFIWWKTRLPLIRDFLYYTVIMIIPSAVVLIGLKYGGVFTSLKIELLAIILYDFAIIILAIILRELLVTIKRLGIIMPVIIMSSALMSPVFIDFKEGRVFQKFFPTFNYLYCIHDGYYVQSLLLLGMKLLIIWYLIHIVMRVIYKRKYI